MTKEQNLQLSINDHIVSSNMRVASSFRDRVVGLMFKSDMEGFDCLLIENCKSIHTCFMKYPIDVVFINSEDEVVKPLYDIQPWRMTWTYFRANRVIEFKSGDLPKDLQAGDKVTIECIN